MSKLDELQGKQVQIFELSLLSNGLKVDLYINLQVNGQSYKLIFQNVSQFRINTISAPLVIGGIEFLSNQSRGWEKNVAFTCRDFEEDQIFFYYQDCIFV